MSSFKFTISRSKDLGIGLSTVLIIGAVGFGLQQFGYNTVFYTIGNLLTTPIAFMALLAICTLGVGLIIEIPVLILLGYVVRTVYGAIVNHSTEAPRSRMDESVIKVPLESKTQAISNYFKAARASGLSEDQIITSLRGAGWSDDEIQSVQQ